MGFSGIRNPSMRSAIPPRRLDVGTISVRAVQFDALRDRGTSGYALGASQYTFWEANSSFADARQPLQAWFREVSRASWRSPAELKAQYRSASVPPDGRVVFNIGGNKYRIVVWIRYVSRTVYIRFVGTHKQYDAIDVQKI